MPVPPGADYRLRWEGVTGPAAGAEVPAKGVWCSDKAVACCAKRVGEATRISLALAGTTWDREIPGAERGVGRLVDEGR